MPRVHAPCATGSSACRSAKVPRGRCRASAPLRPSRSRGPIRVLQSSTEMRSWLLLPDEGAGGWTVGCGTRAGGTGIGQVAVADNKLDVVVRRLAHRRGEGVVEDGAATYLVHAARREVRADVRVPLEDEVAVLRI